MYMDVLYPRNAGAISGTLSAHSYCAGRQTAAILRQAEYRELVMAIRIVQLGTQRAPNEGLRIGTVRRPPRGVPKNKFSSENWYDVWYPNLAPNDALLKLGQSVTTDRDWARFAKKYAAEMKSPDTARTLALLAALSR